MNDEEIIWEIARMCGLFKTRSGEIRNGQIDFIWENGYKEAVPGLVFKSEEEMFKKIKKILEMVRKNERMKMARMLGLYNSLELSNDALTYYHTKEVSKK